MTNPGLYVIQAKIALGFAAVTDVASGERTVDFEQDVEERSYIPGRIKKVTKQEERNQNAL